MSQRLIRFVTTLIVIIAHFVMTAPSAVANIAPVIGQTETCEASFYGRELHGNNMANGEPFNMDDVTVVAHKELPFGTKLIITNQANGRQLVVEVQDRGPYAHGRCVDLSRAGAKALGYFVNDYAGTTEVLVEVCVDNCPAPGTVIEPETTEGTLVETDTDLVEGIPEPLTVPLS